MTRRLLPALLLLPLLACDHQIGQLTLPKGRTDLSSPITTNLRAVFAVSESEVYVAGEGGTVAAFDGRQLSRLPVAGVADTDILWDVAAADTGEVVVIGGTTAETPVLVTRHAGSWTASAGPSGVDNFFPQRLMSTLHIGNQVPRRVVLAGAQQPTGSLNREGYATGFADGVFTPVTIPSTYAPFDDVTGIGATLYFRHVQGVLAIDAWGTDLPGVPAAVITNVVGLSDGRDKYLLGFGFDGSFHTMKNGVWSETQTDALYVNALDGRSINDLYAVASGGGFFHYDGTAWSPLASGTTENLRDVHVLPTGQVWVVGDHGTFFVYVP